MDQRKPIDRVDVPGSTSDSAGCLIPPALVVADVAERPEPHARRTTPRPAGRSVPRL